MCQNGDSLPNLLVELKPGVDLKNAPFDPAKLEKLPYHGLWFMAPTDASTKSSLTEDIQTRVFFPTVGIPEDHVCGAAHTLFAPYWLEKQGAKVEGESKPTLTSRQVSPKGGFLRMQWNGRWAEDNGVVWLSGQGKGEPRYDVLEFADLKTCEQCEMASLLHSSSSAEPA